MSRYVPTLTPLGKDMPQLAAFLERELRRISGALSPSVLISVNELGDYADDTAAATAGVRVSGLYRTGSVVKIRVT